MEQLLKELRIKLATQQPQKPNLSTGPTNKGRRSEHSPIAQGDSGDPRFDEDEPYVEQFDQRPSGKIHTEPSESGNYADGLLKTIREKDMEMSSLKKTVRDK